MTVRRSLAWSYGVQILSLALSFGATVMLTRLLTPYQIGVYAAAMAVTGVLSLVSAIGLGPYLIREKEVGKDTQATAFTVNAALNVAVVLIMWSVSSVSGLLFGDPSISAVLRLLSAGPFLSIFEFLPFSLLMREMRFDAVSLITLGKTAINASSAVTFAFLGWSYFSPAMAVVLAGAFGALAFSVVGRRHVGLAMSLRGWREIATFGVQMISVGGVAAAGARISEVIVGRMLGLAALGLYNRASVLASALWDNVYGIGTRVIFVEMAREQREEGSVVRTFLRSTEIVTAIMWPIVLGVAVLSRPVVNLLYGKAWSGSAVPLSLLMISQFAGMAFAMNWELCVLTRRTGWQARVELVRGVVGVAAVFVGALFSLAAASWGRVVEALVGWSIYRPKMDEMAGARPGQIGAIYRRSMVLAICAVAPSLGLMFWTGWSMRTPLSAIVAAVALGGLFWIVALQRLGHILFKELCAVGSRALKSVNAVIP